MKRLTLCLAALLLAGGAWIGAAQADPGKSSDCTGDRINSAKCDMDGDGVINKDDDDIDGDGIPNADDACPKDATNTCPAEEDPGPGGELPLPDLGDLPPLPDPGPIPPALPA